MFVFFFVGILSSVGLVRINNKNHSRAKRKPKLMPDAK